MKRCVKHYLGVDPGKNGGVCVIRSDGTPLEWIRMPEGKVRIIDSLLNIKEKYLNVIMVVELAQAMPRQGVTSCFHYGQHFATFEDAAILMRIPYHEVRPNVWKKVMGLTSNKLDSISASRRLFPLVDLIPPGCRTEHDGISEALLIAEWARRKDI